MYVCEHAEEIMETFFIYSKKCTLSFIVEWKANLARRKKNNYLLSVKNISEIDSA